jgi:hypothetical protein
VAGKVVDDFERVESASFFETNEKALMADKDEKQDKKEDEKNEYAGAGKPAYPGEPPTRFINGYYVRGISAKELAWHRSRRPQPVTGSAFALDPTAIHECDDVVAQLQKED